MTAAFSSELFPAPDAAYRSTTGFETISATRSWISRSRPKKKRASVLSNGLGPTYGFSSGRIVLRRVLGPLLAQRPGELVRVAPVDDHAHRVEVATEVRTRRLGIARRQLNRDA